MFEQESVAEWILEASKTPTKERQRWDSEWPPLPATSPNLPAERDETFVEGVKWWQSRGIAPTAQDREKWVQRALGLPNRERARKYLTEHKHLMPPEWTKPGRR